jgi:sporulation protein YlmC with PRC-barrel domain
VLSATTIIGDRVRNEKGEDLGKIEELMIDMQSGCISYAVVSFGSVLGLGGKFFAVPFEALQLRADEHKFVLNVDREKLENAPGFDKDNWPESADDTWLIEAFNYWGYQRRDFGSRGGMGAGGTSGTFGAGGTGGSTRNR